jgi:hypothetical protein
MDDTGDLAYEFLVEMSIQHGLENALLDTVAKAIETISQARAAPVIAYIIADHVAK